jgi:hypothetical protein
MHELVLNGVVVGEVEVTGDSDTDAALALQFLKDKGLYKKPDPLKAMFGQALSFATTASYIRNKDLLRSPWNGLSVAPFIVNSAFSIELYLKTLAKIYNQPRTGHDLLELFDSLPPEARQGIDAVLPGLKDWAPAGGVDLRTCISELKTAFVDWRYLYENTAKKEIKIDRVIFVLKVLDETCRNTKAVGGSA